MARAFAREKKAEGVDTRDAILARLLQTLHWMERNRRVVGLLALVLVALGAAAFYYVGYRRDLGEQATAELQQIRVAAGSQNPDLQRELLATFLARYGDTPAADDARVMLAQLELARDSLDAAIRLLEPVAARLGATPTGHAAAGMLAAAHEQAGRPEEAVRVYGAIARQARFEFQRREARAAQARIHAAGGRLREAEAMYAALVGESGADAGEGTAPAEPYALRLGEIRARLAAGGAPEPSPGPDADRTPAGGGVRPAVGEPEPAPEAADPPN